MNIEAYTDTPFGDWAAFEAFLGAHEIAHQTIASKLTGQGKLIAMIPLTESPRGDKDWMLDHYAIHREIAAALGTGVPDLSAYDLDDENQYRDWMFLHGRLHQTINASIGVYT